MLVPVLVVAGVVLVLVWLVVADPAPDVVVVLVAEEVVDAPEKVKGIGLAVAVPVAERLAGG